MIKYQLSHAQFDQINDHKHDMFLYGKLSTKLLARAASVNTKFMLIKARTVASGYPEKWLKWLSE